MAGERLTVYVSDEQQRLDLIRAAADAFAEEAFRTLDADRNWSLWCGGLADLFWRLASDMEADA